MTFPKTIRARFGIGGHFGNGVLFKCNSAAVYYNTTAAPFGIQIGAETFGYAIFFISQKALTYLSDSAGWEIGAGGSITGIYQGLAQSIASTTTQEGLYASVFAQQGLMERVSLNGTKMEIHSEKKEQLHRQCALLSYKWQKRSHLADLQQVS
jgi:lipid-binding SYLF domain-containing protein